MPNAGDIIKVSDVARTIEEARCTSDTSVSSSTKVDITGATTTFSTTTEGVEVIVIATFDVTLSSGTPAPMAGYLVVDGVAQTEAAMFDGPSGDRKTVSQVWYLTLTTEASHTLKLQAALVTGSGGTFTVRSDHTGFVAIVFDETT